MAQPTTRRPMMKGPMRGRGMPVPKGAIKKGTLKRLLKMMFHYYKFRMLLVLVCIVLSSVGSLVSSIFMVSLVDEVITPAIDLGGMTAALTDKLTGLIIMMIAVYSVVILASFTYTRIMAIITQGMLYHLRTEMFAKMQKLPIKYFDTHAHGDIMSSYTNDTDATRQLMGQSLPTILSSSLTLVTTIVLMLRYSFWLFLVVLISTFAMTFVVKKVGGGSAKYMVAQQMSLAQEEGFMEYKILGKPSKESTLLLEAMTLGLKMMAEDENYSEYIDLKFREV